MNNQCTIFLTCYTLEYKKAYIVKALDEDRSSFSFYILFFFSTGSSFYFSFSPLGQTAVSGNSTLHQ